VRDRRYTPPGVVHERVLAQPKEPIEFGSLMSEPQPLLWLTDQREYRIARPREGTRPNKVSKYGRGYLYLLQNTGDMEEKPYPSHITVEHLMAALQAAALPYAVYRQDDSKIVLEERKWVSVTLSLSPTGMKMYRASLPIWYPIWIGIASVGTVLMKWSLWLSVPLVMLVGLIPYWVLHKPKIDAIIERAEAALEQNLKI
jgi:hypothetical protein